MTTPKAAVTLWDGWGPGMSSPVIAAVKDELRERFGSYASKLSAGELYGPGDGGPIAEYQRRVHGEVAAGLRPGPDVRTDGRIDWATQVQLGLIPRATTPATPARPKTVPHLGVMHRGTGGVIGQDITSRVCQLVGGELVEERHPAWAATFGGIPVGATEGGIGAPSMQRAVGDAFTAGQVFISDALRVHPTRGVVLGGYSAGAVVTALLRRWLLENHPDNYVCSFSFGDPTRPRGGAYHLGSPAPGQGISSWRYGDVRDWRHCWLVAPGDMYGSIPGGVVGDILDDGYDAVTAIELSDPLATAVALLRVIPEIAQKIGISLPMVFTALTGGVPGILAAGLPLLISALFGLASAADPEKAIGVAAAAHAALIPLRFIAERPPTAPHIEYDRREVWPGQTHLGLAVQHTRHWCSVKQPIARAA